MISILILSIFVIALFVNYKKTFIVLMVLYTWLSQFKVPGIPISLFAVLSSFAFLLYIVKFGFNRFIVGNLGLLGVSIFLICGSLILSNHFAVYKHYPSLIVNIIVLLNLFILYAILRSAQQKYVTYFVRVCYIYGGFISLYTLFEAITNTNPYIEFVNNYDLYSQDFIITETRFGIKRCQSIFSMHCTLGAVALVLGCLLLYAKQFFKELLPYKYLSLIIFLLFLAVFFTGARSAILGFIICLVMFLNKKYIRVRYIIPLIFICVVGTFFLSDYFSSIYESVVDTEKVGGSNTDMREGQLAIAEYFMNQSFWVGNGLSYTFEFVQANFKDELLGAESLWFPIMIDQGAIGIIVYVFYIVSCCFYVVKMKNYRLLFFVLGVLVFNSMSSIPNFNFIYSMMYILVMIVIKDISRINVYKKLR